MTAFYLSKKDRAYLRLATRMAKKSKCSTRHGAVIVRGGSVLAIGWNINKNHPLVFEDLRSTRAANVSVHAEIAALRKVSDANGATLYVSRVNKSGDTRNSKPCCSCQKSLLDAGVARIVYTESRSGAEVLV